VGQNDGVTTEEPLDGGNVATVVRVGDTVRRPAGPWSEAVHELLRFLEDVGFAYAPRVLGFDEQGREVLTYIDGETVGSVHPWPTWAWADETLVETAHIMRDYHDAVMGFRPAGPRTWRFVTDRVGPDEVVCHNDIAPYNLVYRDGRVAGIIDWDLASPASQAWDVAFAAWAFGPVHTTAHSQHLGAPIDVGRRLKLLCDSYGLDDREGFLDLVSQRLHASITGIEGKAAAGEEPFRRLILAGHLARMREDAAWLAAHAAEWEVDLL
jgi:hypothetical protein